MAKYTVKCPYCKTVKSVTKNMSYHCSGCNATITIGNDGKIKSSKKEK